MMPYISQKSVIECTAFAREFIAAHYTVVELGQLLGKNIAIVSTRGRRGMWTVGELRKIYTNKGFDLSFEIGYNCSTGAPRKPRSGSSHPKAAADENLRFVRDFVRKYNISAEQLTEAGLHNVFTKALEKDDIRMSRLLAFVQGLGAELRIDVTEAVAEQRSRYGAVCIVSERQVRIRNIDTEQS